MVKAAVLREVGARPEVEEIELDAPAAGEVRVRTVASGICHSDHWGQHGGDASLPLPTILGHEAAGVVLEVGSAVTGLEPGDHVVVGPAGSCGVCTWCSLGQPQHCGDLQRVRPDGTPRINVGGAAASQFVGIAGFAEEMLVRSSSVAKVPQEMPLEKAALLGCAVVTGLGAVRHSARVRFGDTVAVIGCGGVGLSAVQGAALSGAARIIAVDVLPEKLALARTFGATDVVDAQTIDPVEAVRDLTRGGVDHALEVVGRPTTISQAFAMLGTRGTATVVGMAQVDDRVELPAFDLLKEKRLQGSRIGGTRIRVDVPLYAQMYLSGRLELDALHGATIDLDGLGEALDELDSATTARTIISF